MCENALSLLYPLQMSSDVMFKVLLVGNAGAGKTSILKRLVYKSFSDQYKSTIGVDFGFYRAELAENLSARLMLYDIAGQERYNILTRNYYKDAYCALVVGDIQSKNLEKDLQSWKSSIDEKVLFPNTTSSIPCYMLVNKSDLMYDITDEELDAICKRQNFLKWFKTSALSGDGLEVAVLDLARVVLDMMKEKGVDKQEEEEQIINVTVSKPVVKQDSGCC